MSLSRMLLMPSRKKEGLNEQFQYEGTATCVQLPNGNLAVNHDAYTQYGSVFNPPWQDSTVIITLSNSRQAARPLLTLSIEDPYAGKLPILPYKFIVTLGSNQVTFSNPSEETYYLTRYTPDRQVAMITTNMIGISYPFSIYNGDNEPV